MKSGSIVWTGHLHFGLVVLPVSLYAAARAETTRFKRIHRRKKPVARALSYLNDLYDPADIYAGDPRVDHPSLPNGGGPETRHYDSSRSA